MHHCSRGVLSAGLGALRRGCTVPAVGGAWQAVEQRTNLNMSNMYVKPYDLTLKNRQFADAKHCNIVPITIRLYRNKISFVYDFCRYPGTILTLNLSLS